MCNIKKSSFEELLQRDGSVSIQHQNIRFLAVEIFNFFKGINPQIVKKIFQFRGNVAYQLRKPTGFQIQFVHSLFSGIESIKFLGPKIWESLPREIKTIESTSVLLAMHDPCIASHAWIASSG